MVLIGPFLPSCARFWGDIHIVQSINIVWKHKVKSDLIKTNGCLTDDFIGAPGLTINYTRH